MPQFDLFIWISLSFFTILFFQAIYFLVTLYILPELARLQKTLVKLNILASKTVEPTGVHKKISLLELFLKLYFNSKK